MKRVLLVQPPGSHAELFRYDVCKRRRYQNYPPYGLGVIAQHLRSVGVEVSIVNLHHEVLQACQASTSENEFHYDEVWQKKLDEVVVHFQPDLVAVTCMFTMVHVSLRNVCSYLGEKGLPLAIGGVHVSNDSDHVIQDIPSADLVFLREGDIAIKKFVHVVNKQLPATELGQLIVIDKLSGERLLFPRNLEPTPEEIAIIPAFDLMDLDHLSLHGPVGAFFQHRAPGTLFATVLGNRGCRAQCTFCSVRNFNGPGVRQRNIASIVDELEILQNDYGIGHVMWLDDDLLKDRARIIALCNEMVRRQLKLTWDATNGLIAASCTEEVVAALAASGCIGVNLGIESGNPKILRDVRKPGTVENFLAAADVFRKHESIFTCAFLIIGFPGETMKMILDTINLARTMNLDWHYITLLQPLPNTAIYKYMVAQGLINDTNDPRNSNNGRFTRGSYGRGVVERDRRFLRAHTLEEAFANVDLDQVPNREQLEDTWLYMSFHLNCQRLLGEERPVKLVQELRHLRFQIEQIDPGNCLNLYCEGLIQKKLYGKVARSTLESLQYHHARSQDYQEWFSAFDIGLERLTDVPTCEVVPSLWGGKMMGYGD